MTAEVDDVDEEVVVEEDVAFADDVVVVEEGSEAACVEVVLDVVVVAFVVVVHWQEHTPPAQRMRPPDCSHDKGSREVEQEGIVVEVEDAMTEVVDDVEVVASAKVLTFRRVDVVSSVFSIVMHPQISNKAANTAR